MKSGILQRIRVKYVKIWFYQQLISKYPKKYFYCYKDNEAYMRKWTLSEYWRIKAWLLPIAFLIIFLWIFLGCPEIFGKLVFPLILGATFGILYFLIVYYLKMKEAK